MSGAKGNGMRSVMNSALNTISNNVIDRVLNRITMYRLMLYYAAGLLVAGLALSAFGFAPGDPVALALSSALVIAACWATNRVFALILRVPVNAESVHITALIIVLIMPPAPPSDLMGLAGLVLASIVAIASKFLLAIGRKHIFNPVAIGVAASGLLLDQPATWWVGGNVALLPLVLLGGLLVVRKLQRFDMLGSYVLANLVLTQATTPLASLGEAWTQSLLYSPLLFAGFAMLTEPLTAPQAGPPRILYGALVGALCAPDLHIGTYYFTPEVALLVGNLFAFAVNPKGRLKLTLLRIEKLTPGCTEFVFRPDRKLVFRPGQYLDWTLDVAKPDARGNRRPFTIASAPGDDEVRLGVKFYANPSAFKRSLAAMQAGEVIYASQLTGDFTLPEDTRAKLAFIAGGIGVTPFRSMVQDMLNRRQMRPLVILYGNETADEIAYAEVFDRAGRELGTKTVYAVADGMAARADMHRGLIDAALIEREVPDYNERTFYISGPRAMVLRFRRVLKELGIPGSRIKEDFFPGFA